MKKIACSLFLCLVSMNLILYAQEDKQLKIGDKVPENLWATLKLKQTTKLVILDFWSTGCTTCVGSFPHMEQLQNEFADQLQIFFIDSWESMDQIIERMEHQKQVAITRDVKPISLPTHSVIGGDTLFRQVFPSCTIPHHVWLDNNGTVLAITSDWNATAEHIQAILEGKKVKMHFKDDLTARRLTDSGYIIPRVKDMPVIYYSAFVPFYSAYGSGSFYIDSAKKLIRKTEYNGSVVNLYESAFWYDKPERTVREIKNKQQFERPQDDNQVDDWNEKYSFTYEIQAPLNGGINSLMENMKQDLDRFFGNKFGLTGGMEKRVFTTYTLVKTKELKPADPKKEKKFFESTDSIFTTVNYPFGVLVAMLTDKFEDADHLKAFFDESKVDGSLRTTMKLKGDLKDVANLNKQLNKYGLQIQEEKKELNVLVIKDKSNSEKPAIAHLLK